MSSSASSSTRTATSRSSACSLSDIIVLYKEFPHTDVVERAEDVLDLVLGTLRGKIKPVMSMYDCRQIQSYPTTLPLMRAFVDKIMAMEGKDGVLSISIGHCFPYADVAGDDGAHPRHHRRRQGQGRPAGHASSARSSCRCAARPLPDYRDVDEAASTRRWPSTARPW